MESLPARYVSLYVSLAAVKVLRFDTLHLVAFDINYNYARTYSFVKK